MKTSKASTFKAATIMKVKAKLRHVLLLAGSSLLAISSAYAQSGTWLGNGSAWNDAAAWSGGTIANGIGNSANFTGVDITSGVSMALGADRTIGNITFADATNSSHNLTLTGNTLTLDVSSGAPIIDVTQAGRTLTISSIVAGNEGLQKIGTGTLTLSATNTYSGTATISAGTLRMQGMDPMNGATRTYSIGSGAVLHVNGVGTLTKVITINGTGTFRISGGYFQSGGNNMTLNLGAGGLIDIQSGATLATWYGFGGNWTGNQATLNVDGMIEGNNAITINASALTGAGTINNGAVTTMNIGTNNGSGTFSGAIQNAATLIKTGTGTQTISGNNSYTGSTTVNGGTLLLDKTGAGALGSSSALTLGGGTFKILGKSGAFTTAQTLGALTVNGGGSQIVLDANGGTSTTLTLANSAPTRTAAGGTLVVDLSSTNTVLSSTLGLTAGSQTGTQALLGYATLKDATNTGFAANVGGKIVRYTGAEELLAASNSGTTNYKITPVGTTTSGSPLLTTAASAVYNSLSIDTSGATGANFLSLSGTVSLTQKALLMTGSNNFTIQGGTQLGVAGSEVIVHQAGAGTLTISSLISSGAGALTKGGAGTLILSGNNPYTGQTTINAGELRLSGGAFTTTAGRTYQIGIGAVMSLGASGAIPTGTTKTTIQGAGTLRVLNGVTISGGSEANRQINMNLGAGALIDVQAGGNFSLGYQPIIWLNNKATLNMDGNHDLWDDNAIVAAALTGSGTISSTASDSFGGTKNITLGVENGSGTFTGNITAAGARVFTLTKDGTGTQVFTGSVTFKGATTINAGTLQYAKTNSLYAGVTGDWTAARINVKSGATLALNVDSAGTAGFTSANLNTLLTAIYGGTSTSQGLQAGATLGLDTSTANGGTFTQGNVIANSTGTGGGALGLTKQGTGTLVLDKTNTYTGVTTVKTGTLSLGADNTIGASTNMVLSGGTLTMGSYSNSVGTLTVTTNSTIVLGSGTLRFADSKSMNWTGGTLYLSGALGATTLRFGDSADDLTPGQLAKININGWLGGCTLDANGYLAPPRSTLISFF